MPRPSRRAEPPDRPDPTERAGTAPPALLREVGRALRRLLDPWPTRGDVGVDGERRTRRLAEARRRWSPGDPAPTPVPAFPAGSLGDRLFSDSLFASMLEMPSLTQATVPDAEVIHADPAQWTVAAWVLARAVVLDGLGAEDPAVADSSVRTVDLEAKLSGAVGPMLEPLKDVAFFAQASVDPETRSVLWPNGADVAPEVLHAGAFDAVTAA